MVIVNESRTLCHRLTCILYLGECDTVTESLKAKHLHNKSVKTKTDTAVRRCTVFECICEEAELFVRFFVTETEK